MRYVGFEGAIGAGKTTLSRLFSDRYSTRLVLEEFQENDFLADFYEEKTRWALGMQLWFLAARHEQLSTVGASGDVTSDYSFSKDGIFAEMLLAGRELRLYRTLAGRLAKSLATPSLIVLLDASDDVLLERIRLRGRAYEQSITSEYLRSLRSAYSDYYRNNPSLRVMRVETSKLDLSSSAELDSLFEKIQAGSDPSRSSAA